MVVAMSNVSESAGAYQPENLELIETQRRQGDHHWPGDRWFGKSRRNIADGLFV
jgi:hypothetical protein